MGDIRIDVISHVRPVITVTECFVHSKSARVFGNSRELGKIRESKEDGTNIGFASFMGEFFMSKHFMLTANLELTCETCVTATPR